MDENVKAVEADLAAEKKGRLILISGGARSGKSRAALTLARRCGPRRLYVATAQAFDKEMDARISKHREERPDFETFEEPRNLSRLDQGDWDCIIVDCLTLWISNLLMEGRNDEEISKRILDDIHNLRQKGRTLILISNEVGFGIVPENALARRFRDLNGFLQQAIGQRSDELYLAFAGRILPLHQLGEDAGC